MPTRGHLDIRRSRRQLTSGNNITKIIAKKLFRLVISPPPCLFDPSPTVQHLATPWLALQLKRLHYYTAMTLPSYWCYVIEQASRDLFAQSQEKGFNVQNTGGGSVKK